MSRWRTWFQEMLSMRLLRTEKRCKVMFAGACARQTVACEVAGSLLVAGRLLRC
jgi:hypothetical protein